MKSPAISGWAAYAAMLAAGSLVANGQLLLNETFQFTGGPLPMTAADGSSVPVSDSRTVISDINQIFDVNVSFVIRNAVAGGAYNGDFYASLTHSSGFAVLLNRVGVRSGATPDAMLGYGDNGFSVTLDDQAANGDIHTYRLRLPLTPGGPAGGSHDTPVDPAYLQPLTGAWAPDGRNVSSQSVTIESSRTAMLSSFNGLPASGQWVFTFADLSPGGTASLQSWSIDVSGSAVPEPAETAGMAAVGLLAAAIWFRRHNAGSR